MGGAATAVTGKRLRTWLLQLRNSHCLFRESPLIDTVLDGYNRARHGAEVGASQCHLLTLRVGVIAYSKMPCVCVLAPVLSVGFW